MASPLAWLVATVLVAHAASARADRPLAADNPPPAWQAECASCHVPFPPALLPATSWRRIFAALDQHYGVDASLDQATRDLLERFHVRHAGPGSPANHDAAPRLPRLTETRWFAREHREVPGALWRDPAVKSASHCAACHTRAAEASYREREIRLPGGRRHDDDD